MKLPPMRSSDIFGLVRGKIALINAVHIGDPGIKPIELTTQFLNALGATVVHGTKTVHPMQAIYFDYEFDASLKNPKIRSPQPDPGRCAGRLARPPSSILMQTADRFLVTHFQDVRHEPFQLPSGSQIEPLLASQEVVYFEALYFDLSCCTFSDRRHLCNERAVEQYLANVLAFVDYRVLSVRSLLNWAVQSWRKQIVSSF
jgi:hypothetical protein